MDLHDRHHHHHHRPGPISLPPRAASPRLYPAYPFPSTPAQTPSKLRRPAAATTTTTTASLLLLLASLQPLYTILPFLRSAPSPLSLFPFSFLLSLLSFLLSLPLLPSPQLSFPSPRLLPALAADSALLALSFLLRFLSLRSCGTGPTILAEFSGSLAAHFAVSPGPLRRHARGLAALLLALLFLSVSWDRSACFAAIIGGNCLRASAIVLPFATGLVRFYENSMSSSTSLRQQLGKKRVKVMSLFLTTIVLFFPAAISFYTVESAAMSISFRNLGWPLLNTAVFGVVLSDYFTNDGGGKVSGSRDLRRSFGITFLCTVTLELFYFPELSLFGFSLCGLLLWVSVMDLSSLHSQYPELGSDSSDHSFSSLFWNMIRHILSERKSRKIALFLLINTGYMVVEFGAGFMSNSLGLISDACHMLFDCAALAIGLYASYISRLPANGQYNYGRGRFEILSGYVNAVLLVLVGALIVLESFERILDPQEISTNSLLFVSIGGLVVNVVGLIFFHEEHHHAHGGTGSCSHTHHHGNHLHHQHQHHHHHHHHHHACDHEHGHHNMISIASDPSVENSSKNHHHSHNHESHEAQLASYSHKHEERDKHQASAPNAISDHLHKKDENNHCCGHRHEHDEHSHDVHPHVVADHHADHLHFGERVEKEAHKPRHVDHNMEGIFLHVLADTMGSVGVVISTLLIKYKGWLVADPACSIFISVLIISSVIPLLRNSAEILLQRIPRLHESDLRLALNDVLKMKGIQSLQNVHLWSLTNTDIVGTLHLHVSATTDIESSKKQVLHILNDAGINDLTLQLEHVKVT